MKKLMMLMIGLCNIFSVIAMQQSVLTITAQESENFLNHLNRVCNYSNNLITTKTIDANNAIHIILNKLSNSLAEKNNNIIDIIDYYGLEDRLKEYEKFEFSTDVMQAKEKIKREQANTLLKDTRVSLVREELKKKWPQYIAPTKAVQVDPANFLVNNKDYPANNEEAVKDYLAMFIYQLIFASRA